MTISQPSGGADGRAALERLAAALSRRDFATTLVTGDGRPPRLTVTSRHAPLSEEIWVDCRAYRWSWAEPIAGVSDPLAAAQKITNVLRAARTRRG
jgi:hypothetical protein